VRPILILGTLLVVATLAPLSSAHARERVDVDLRAHADLAVEADAGAEVRHAYAHAGRYHVALRVTDEETGDCWTERREVRVEPRAEAGADAEDAPGADGDSDGDGGISAEASVGSRPGLLGVRADVGLDHGRAPPARESRVQGSASTSVASSDERSVPAPGAALLVPGLGAGALLLRRRRAA
jgi:hypothetical protein